MGLGLLLGVLSVSAFVFTSNKGQNRDCIERLEFTNPSIGCSQYQESLERMRSLDQSLEDAVKLYIKEGKAKRISVWVRDLETKQWAAVNEFDTFTPASLLKVPLMITYFKLAELQPSILDEKFVYERSDALNSDNQTFKPRNPLVPGQAYSVENLIERMVTDSDNSAAAMLAARLDNTLYRNTLVELGLNIPINVEYVDFLTAKSYGNVFRVLYNASYLTRPFSEKALSVMSRSAFKGIAESVPAETAVSHKFGERQVDDAGGHSILRELHDCGIVYKKERVYSLCIMTQGNNFDDLYSVIKSFSTIVYEAM